MFYISTIALNRLGMLDKRTRVHYPVVQFTVTRGDHDHNRMCNTCEFAVQVSSNTRDFRKKLDRSH